MKNSFIAIRTASANNSLLRRTMHLLVSRGSMKSYLYAILFIFLILPPRTLADREHSDKDVKMTERPLSQETKACLACHEMFTRASWETGSRADIPKIRRQRLHASPSSKEGSRSVNWMLN